MTSERTASAQRARLVAALAVLAGGQRCEVSARTVGNCVATSTARSLEDRGLGEIDANGYIRITEAGRAAVLAGWDGS